MSYKRYLGSKKLFNIEGRTLSPEFIASLIIRSLKRNAEEFLCTKIGKIFVSVPANFNIIQQNALAKACDLAGLDVFRLIGEPCAASILLQDTIYSDSKQDKLVLVIDLGGGTFDVSVMSIGEGVYETIAITGDNSLGGIDYDNAIYKYIVSKVQSLIENPNYVLNEVDKSQIRFEAERVKIALNSRYETSVILQNLEVNEHGLKNFEILISREQFRKLTNHLNSKVETCILRALNINPFYIDALGGINLVLLAGQGSKIFTVNEIIEKLFPEVPIVRNFQESAVVHGLCKYTGVLDGSLKEDIVLLDACYTGVGIACMPKPKGEETREDFVISGDETENTSTFTLLPPSTIIPCFHSYAVSIKNIKGDKITLKIAKKSTIEGVSESIIGNISVEVKSIAKYLGIAVDCDQNRTIVLWITNPSKKEITGFRINNFFHEASFHREMQTEGYKIQPIEKLNAG